MSEKADTFLFPDGQRSNVVKLPWRKFPAIAIQGDTWSIYLSNLRRSLSLAQKMGDEVLIDELEYLVECFESQQENYESILKENGYSLPYENSVK
ncbi:MAG: hypothetical protein AB2565_07030 [Candidatus Thiodiazotropha endolucinida]|uniref:Uncharacterized protein n=1 Tax=Candidatus Thiodiazotropha endolucinida TaxID=1655433 RepID=A0A7Z0VKN2_9GAMM|nr:hypothetical protein [Candidatus Thiodiazotropha endolucinida]ODJ87392.1 hypothetical protein CODIS_23670 [Candidatus Thiodiazotropha endolucinida]